MNGSYGANSVALNSEIAEEGKIRATWDGFIDNITRLGSKITILKKVDVGHRSKKLVKEMNEKRAELLVLKKKLKEIGMPNIKEFNAELLEYEAKSHEADAAASRITSAWCKRMADKKSKDITDDDIKYYCDAIERYNEHLDILIKELNGLCNLAKVFNDLKAQHRDKLVKTENGFEIKEGKNWTLDDIMKESYTDFIDEITDEEYSEAMETILKFNKEESEEKTMNMYEEFLASLERVEKDAVSALESAGIDTDDILETEVTDAGETDAGELEEAATEENEETEVPDEAATEGRDKPANEAQLRKTVVKSFNGLTKVYNDFKNLKSNPMKLFDSIKVLVGSLTSAQVGYIVMDHDTFLSNVYDTLNHLSLDPYVCSAIFGAGVGAVATNQVVKKKTEKNNIRATDTYKESLEKVTNLYNNVKDSYDKLVKNPDINETEVEAFNHFCKQMIIVIKGELSKLDIMRKRLSDEGKQNIADKKNAEKEAKKQAKQQKQLEKKGLESVHECFYQCDGESFEVFANLYAAFESYIDSDIDTDDILETEVTDASELEEAATEENEETEVPDEAVLTAGNESLLLLDCLYATSSAPEFKDFLSENKVELELYGLVDTDAIARESWTDVESEESEVATEARNIVRLNREAQINRETARIAIGLAKQANDSLYKYYHKYSTLKREFRDKIYNKYGQRAQALARRSLMNSRAKASMMNSKTGSSIINKIDSRIKQLDASGRNKEAIQK